MTYIWYKNAIDMLWLKFYETNLSNRGEARYNIFKRVILKDFKKKSLDFEKYLLILPTKLCKKYCNLRTGMLNYRLK